MSEAAGAAGPSGARRRSCWLPLAVGGLLLGGAVALYAWTNTWAVALAAGALLAVLWYRGDGHGRLRRACLATAVALVALAVALPLLTQALPSLAALWLRGPWVKGLPALLITASGLGILAWVEHSRGLARLTVIYAVVALGIGGWLASVPDYVLMFWPALAPQPWHLTPLDALLGPAAVLIAAGVALRWRGRRPGPGRLPA